MTVSGRVAASVLAFFIQTIHGAFAQSGPAAEADPDRVVITATRFPQPAESLPASVSVITRADIARSPARTIPELLSSLAGISSRDFFGNNAGAAAIDLRGYGVTGAQNTLVLVDGQRLNDVDLTSVQWSSVSLGAIERIEVLRGSGAVAYGDGASAGVVNIITRSPLAGRGSRDGTDTEWRVGGGTFGTAEAEAGAAFSSGTFGIRAHGYGYASHGYRTNNRNEQKNGSVRMRWSDDTTTLDLRAGVDRGDTRLPGARRVQPSIGLNELLADRRGAQTPLDYASRDGTTAGLSLSHHVGDAELSVAVDYRNKDQRSYFDQGGFPASRADDLDMRSVTPRLRLPFSTGVLRHGLVVGADWTAWQLVSRRTPRPDDFARPVNRVRVDRDNGAWFLQDAIEWGATRFLLGYRGERARYDARDAVDPSAPGFFFNTAAPATIAVQRARAWEAGAQHAFDSRWTGFARAARSFRLVNVDEIYENDAFFSAQFQMLRPQSALTHEIGVRWNGGANRARVTIFTTDVTDEIHLDPFTTGVGNTNLPPSRRRGVELDAGWAITPAIRLTGAYSYTDARYLQGTLPGALFAIGTNLDIAGRRVPLVSKHKINLGLAWDIGAATRVTASLSSLSRQFMDNDEPNTLGTGIPRRTLVDLKLSHDLGWGRASVTVNNLFDRRYHEYAVRSAFTADRYAVYPLAGTTIGLSLEARIP